MCLSCRLQAAILMLSLSVSAACVQTPVPSSAPLVEILSPKDVSIVRSTEIVQQDNCGGTADVENTISKSVTFSSDFAFTVGVTVDARGNATILGTGVELGAAVATELGTSYGKSETEERSVTVRAPPHSRMEHTITQAELRKEGIARVTIGGSSQEVPFGFRYGVQLVLDESRSLPCPAPATTVVSPTIISTGAVTPTLAIAVPVTSIATVSATLTSKIRSAPALTVPLDGDLVSLPSASSNAFCDRFRLTNAPESSTAFAAEYSFSGKYDYCSYVIGVPPGFDPQFHTHLSFRAKTKTEPLRLGIGRRNAGKDIGDVEDKKYYTVTNTWESFLIPLADLPPGGNAASDSVINSVTLGFDGNTSAHASALFLDDFAFVAPAE